ncbi:MAG: NAD(P)/FAD-dependent oxidoreductase [Gammaproteobacteria bacterium]|nr:NAD(P)/FAD-dependent oxidoreductase [Gammaproteobacteria bacterium]
MKQTCQLVVIGAGPAGMAAAQTAAEHGVDVTLFDDQAQPGGQIYRNVDTSPLADTSLLGKDYVFGQPLVQAFRHAELDYYACTSVWYLDKAREIGILKQGVSHKISAQRVIVASGAQERPMPVPNWQLPGVMTAGAGQILLKSAAMVPDNGVVLAGNGPLMLLLAWQYLRAGVNIHAILDTTPKGNLFRALRYLPRALAAGNDLWKGLRMMLSIATARVPYYHCVSELRAEGDNQLQAVSFSAAGRHHRIDTDLLLLHQGLIPGLHILQAAGCEIEWNPAQQSWQTPVDVWGETSLNGIFVAGDGGGIAGARAASLSGQLAGLQVAHQLGLVDIGKRDQLARPIINSRNRHLAIRPFLDAFYAVPETFLNPADETLVCRCEEVSARQIRDVIALGCIGPNQAKAFTRCGMGPCQGRYCADTVAHIFAHQLGVSVADIGHYNARAPLKPITLGQLAETT